MASSSPSFLPEPTDSSVAWLFPGQGAQEVGMGRDLYEGSAAAREVFDVADSVLGYPLSQICFEGPEDRLRLTEYTQPAILATSLAALAAAVESGLVTARPAYMAGHSLGEYSALVAAGALSLEDGLALLAERARLMAEAGRRSEGTLAAIIGLEEGSVRALCEEASADVCNLNLPLQTVIGGTREAVERAMALARERGAARVQELNVSGAFHSRLMTPAAEGLAAAIAQARVGPPAVPVVANASAAAMTSPEEVRHELLVQVNNPVRWHQSVTLMASAGVNTFMEFGPGRVLTGLAKRLVPGARLMNASSHKDVLGGITV